MCSVPRRNRSLNAGSSLPMTAAIGSVRWLDLDAPAQSDLRFITFAQTVP